MKKASLALVIIVVAVLSSAATIGVMKYLETRGPGGPIIILTDKRCDECAPERLEASLKRTFPTSEIAVIDYGDRKGRKLYAREKLDKLPAVLVPKGMNKEEDFKKISRFAALGNNYYALRTGGAFDPTAEICDNGKDDTGNGLVDCDDPTCKTDWRCMEKRERPDVDLFVMSHCPYGTQIEKGLLPVWDLLGDKMNLTIRFVDYAMHGKKEIDEELRQYCIQKADRSKYRTYLECFLKGGEAGDACVKKANVDKKELSACIEQTDKKFNVSKNFGDKSTWKGRFPTFSVHADLVQKYGVRGSPTLVINDVVAKSGRSPQALLEAICYAFKDKPKECTTKLEAASPSPGFGFGKERGRGAAGSKCGA